MRALGKAGMRDKLFDSSAIMNLVRRNELDGLLGNFTLTLASYEVGNALLKGARSKSISLEEAIEALEAIRGVIERMVALGVDGEGREILVLAEREGLTYYDASYLHMAIKCKLALVTDDGKLLEKAKKYVEAFKSAQA